MGIALIVTREYDENFEETGEEILEEEWEEFVASQDNLRMRTEPYVAVNPATGASISMAAPPGSTEVLAGTEWVPFLYHRGNHLTMGYSENMESSEDPVRKAIAGVAGYFAAIITHDAGDEILNW